MRVGGGAQEAGCGPPDSRSSLDLGDGLVDGLGHVVDVLGGQPAHVDAAAGHQVDVLLFDHVFNLFSCETKTQRIDVRKKTQEETGNVSEAKEDSTGSHHFTFWNLNLGRIQDNRYF